MKKAILPIILTLVLPMASCMPDTSGVNPPKDSLFFPVGMSLTEGDDYLLVANSNFDLRYNGGTLVAIDLGKFAPRDTSRLGAIEADPSLCLDDSSEKSVLEKVACAIHCDSEGCESADAYNKWFSEDRSELYIPESAVINVADTIAIGSFASDLDITPQKNRAIIPVRGERTILIVDIDPSRQNGSLLNCGTGEDVHCDKKHRIESNDKESLPIEPYEVTSFTRQGDNPGDVGTYGVATHLYGGEVSLFQIDHNGILDADLLNVATNVVPGASGVATNLSDERIYVTGRNDPTPHLAVLRVLPLEFPIEENHYFNRVSSIEFGKEISAGTDARGLAIDWESATPMAYMVTRNPEALLKIDLEQQKLVDMTTLGTDPSVVGLYRSATTGETTPFVLCFLSDQVYIVDPELMQVHVRATGSGPHAMAFDKTRRQGYIANFGESTISVINAEPPYEHLFINVKDPKTGTTKRANVWIGKPRLPEGHN